MKKISFIALSLLMAVTLFAQEKKVKVVEHVTGKTLSQILGSDRYEIDSLVIVYEFSDFTANDFNALRDCCEKGRLSGIDMSRCRYVENGEIPAAAFLPKTVNGLPGKNMLGNGDDGEKTFRTNLRYITLPNNIRKIGDYAFSDTNLEEIGIPHWTKEIAVGAFSGCQNLKNVTLYGNRRKDDAAGYGFDGLAPDAVLHVAPGLGNYYRNSSGWAVFGEVREDEAAYKAMDINIDGGSTLEVLLGDYDMRVDSVTLSGTPSADDMVALKRNVEYGRLFCLNLTDCTIDAGNLFSCDIESLIMPRRMTGILPGFLSRSNVSLLVLPENYDEIHRTAFEYFRSFTDSTLVIPEGCGRIGYRAFNGCDCIKTLVLPSTMEELEPASLSFNSLYKAPAVDLYVNRMIPPAYFHGCRDFGPDSDPDETGPFDCRRKGSGCMTRGWRLFVPVGAKANYENAEHWDHFATIIETPLLTGVPTGINAAPHSTQTPAADGIYTMDGRLVTRGSSVSALPKGLYIVKEGGKARKIVGGR